MGNNANCGCIEKNQEDSELLTDNEDFIFSKSSKRNNKIKISLFSFLKDKMLYSNITLNSIKKKYLNELIEQNPKSSSIINSYIPQIKSLYNTT